MQSQSLSIQNKPIEVFQLSFRVLSINSLYYLNNALDYIFSTNKTEHSEIFLKLSNKNVSHAVQKNVEFSTAILIF